MAQDKGKHESRMLGRKVMPINQDSVTIRLQWVYSSRLEQEEEEEGEEEEEEEEEEVTELPSHIVLWSGVLFISQSLYNGTSLLAVCSVSLGSN